MRLTQFEITKKQGLKVSGDYEGNNKSGKAVVFSHGFGVTRTDHGMFSDLGDKLKDDFLVVRFDYNKIEEKDGKSMEVPSYSTQAKILDAVLDFVRSSFNPEKLNIVAHSQGGIIVGQLQPKGINKIIINATPLRSPYKRFKEYFMKRKGTVFNERGLSIIPRSDGSTTYIGKEFWPELKAVEPFKLFTELSKLSEVYLIKAKDDRIVVEDTKDLFKKKTDNINYIELEGGHDFSGEARKKWMDLNREILLNS